METVTRAVCASVSRIEGSVMDQLLSIRNELCGPGIRNRARFALLHTSGWFVLCVEGSDAAVDAVLKHAATDSRNEHQKILHRSRGPAWLRERVIVATTHSPLRPTHFARWVMHMMDKGQRLEPADIWNRLGAPCLVDHARIPCARPLHQFAIVSADDHGPVDQLRKIGEASSSPVVYQRFALARSHMPDLGMAYVDVPVHGGAARVRVVSRKAIAQPSVRHSMPALDGIAILIGTRPAVAIELAMNVADALKGHASPPPVWVVGEPGEPTAACARLLARCGIDASELHATSGGHVDVPGLLPFMGLHPRGHSVSPSGPAPRLPVNRLDGSHAHPFLRSQQRIGETRHVR
jgi:hypothetical protein